jgi:CO/xanthine dehydrogenase Mo-binding subunit
LGRTNISALAIKTNIPPQGPLAGFGLSQGFFALERHISKIADDLQEDPAEWRKNHIFKEDSKLALCLPIEKPPLETLIDGAVKMSDYSRKWASYELLRRRSYLCKLRDRPVRGIGLAVAYQGSGFLYNETHYTVELVLNENNFLEIKAGLISINDEFYFKLWRKMAKDILSIKEENVLISFNNTNTVLDIGIASNSKNITTITNLVELALLSLQKELLIRRPPISIQESYEPILKKTWGKNTEKLFDGKALTDLSWCACVVEVEINPVEYLPLLRGIWLAIDGGKILSERNARRTLNQAVIHTLGWTMWEDMDYVQGKLSDFNTYNYNMPTLQEFPPIHINFIQENSSIHKGIGELPFNTVPAAYVQAVSQAMDYHFEKLPLTARDLWESGKCKNKGDI